MKVDFTLTGDEFLEGQRVFNRQLASKLARFNYRFATPVAVLLILDGVVFLVLAKVAIGLVLALWGAWTLANRKVLWPRRMRKEYTQYPDMQRSMEFGDGGLAIQTSHGKSELLWSRMTRFVETEKVFVLFAPPRFLYTVPKRVFSVTELHEFRQLVQRNVPAS